MSQNETASVEDILESIKKVIARDNREGAGHTRRQREMEGLKQVIEDGSDESEEDHAPDNVLELGLVEISEEDDDFEAEDDIEAIDVSSIASTDGTQSLVSDAVRSSMQENLAALAMMAEPGAQPRVVRSGETSLEGLVTEMLRPMLAEWLDQNLPTMVETLVKAEIARIAGKSK